MKPNLIFHVYSCGTHKAEAIYEVAAMRAAIHPSRRGDVRLVPSNEQCSICTPELLPNYNPQTLND